MGFHSDAFARMTAYAERRGLVLHERLGHGKDGIVFETANDSAIKAFVARRPFFNEISVYMRLYDLDIEEIEGFAVPRFVARDDELMIIEMSIVAPPCVLDFANAGLDGPPHEFPADILEAEEARHREIFEDRWPDVVRVRAALRRHGVFITDLSPYNVMFAEDDE